MLIVAVAASAGAALLGARRGSEAAAPLVAPSAEAARPAAQSAENGKAAIAGKVEERIDVEKYTYLRLDVGGTSTWCAVSSSAASAALKLGDVARVTNAELMTNFQSATLKRKFERIYFGALDVGASSGAAGIARAPGADPHAGVPGAPPLAGVDAAGADPHAGVPGAPPLGAARSALGAGDPHGSPAASGDSVAVGSVAKAEGDAGRTVAQIHAARRELANRSVRVRGVVVKSVSGVLGRTFVHVRDGSGSADQRDQDLTITTTAKPAVGERAVFEGKVVTDKDFGAGYTYPVLLEDAQIVGQ